MKEFPSKIFFFCSEPSPEGGETSIVPSHIIVEKMEERMPEFVKRLSETGCIFSIKTPKDEDSGAIVSKTWKWLLQTDNQVEAEKRYALCVKLHPPTPTQFQNYAKGTMIQRRQASFSKIWPLSCRAHMGHHHPSKLLNHGSSLSPILGVLTFNQQNGVHRE